MSYYGIVDQSKIDLVESLTSHICRPIDNLYDLEDLVSYTGTDYSNNTSIGVIYLPDILYIYHNALVPDKGPAPLLGGELIRAAYKIATRFDLYDERVCRDMNICQHLDDAVTYLLQFSAAGLIDNKRFEFDTLYTTLFNLNFHNYDYTEYRSLIEVVFEEITDFIECCTDLAATVNTDDYTKYESGAHRIFTAFEQEDD